MGRAGRLICSAFEKYLAAILYLKRVMSDDMLEPPKHIAQGKEIPDGVLVYRIFGPFFLAPQRRWKTRYHLSASGPRF